MKLSLFTVSYAGLWGQDRLDLPALIEKARELGYDTLMVMGKRPHLSPLDASADLIARLKDTLQRCDMSCDVIAAYTDFAPTTAVEVPYVEMQIAYVESLARIASQLGASIVRVFTAYEWEGHNPYAVWKSTVSALREASDRVAKYGITLAVQNHHDIGVHTDALLELLTDVDRPNCKLGFDAWSPALRGEDLYKSAQRAAPFTVITTNADYVRFPRFHHESSIINFERIRPDLIRAVKFGEGFIDYPAFFRGLRDGGFDGIANYEMCSPIRGGGELTNLDAYARHYVRWCRENGVVQEA